MKSLSYTLLVVLLVIGFIFVSGCSRIEVQNPAKDGQNISTPYTMVVKHSGCGSVKSGTFQAWLDKDTDAPQEITSAFSYAQDTWTAADYNRPNGNHS